MFKRVILPRCLFGAMAILSAMSLTCCSDKEEPSNDTNLQEAVSNLDGIVRLRASSLGDWSEGYATSEGFVLLKADAGRSSRSVLDDLGGGSDDSDGPDVGSEAQAKADALSYASTDGSRLAHLFTSEEGLPMQLVVNNTTLYFNFLNDNILELALETGDSYEYKASVDYDKGSLMQKVDNADYPCLFQDGMAYIVALVETVSLPSDFKSVLDAFRDICGMGLADDQDKALENLEENGLLNEDGIVEVAETTSENYDDVSQKVNYSIMLWTGKASFKVGGTSCTLSGAVHCASPAFNYYGSYGIVCDTDIEKLYVENAEYTGTGYQPEGITHFDVDFRGLRANTTYYYRAFYRFNNYDHGDLSFRYGDPNADIAYDTVVKSFTTGDNVLTVDVVMCIDATGSMSSIINTVKANAISFYDSFMNKCEANGIELSGLNTEVVAFRDINADGDQALVESPKYILPDDRTYFNDFVNSLSADGGGDTPESGLEALKLAFNKLVGATDDGYHRQVIILWTDAPYLIGSYSTVELSEIDEQWNSLSSGRRLILFAPSGTSGDSNSGNWDNFDSWKNVIHSTDITSSFNDFDYILDSIIEELIGRGTTAAPLKVRKDTAKSFRPNAKF